MKNNYRKFIKDFGLVGIANIAGMSKGLILLPILTKALGPGDYGLWVLIQATISLMMPIAILQLGFAMTRFLAAEKDTKIINTGFSTIFIATSFSALIISFLFFISVECFAPLSFGSNPLPQIIAFLIFISSLDQIILEYFVGFRQMERYAIFITVQSIGDIALISYGILNNYGLLGAISSLIIIRILLFIVGFLRVRSEIRICKPDYSILKSYLIFSLPLLPFTLFQWIIDLSDRYAIKYFMDLDAVGIYSAACGIGTIVSLFYAPIAAILLPTITNLYENGNIEDLELHLKYSLKIFLILAIPSLFGLSILSKSLLTSLSTPEFAIGYLVVPIIALGTILQRCSWIFSNVIMLFKESKIMATIYGFSALINALLNIILIPIIGIMGAAVATLMSIIIIFLITQHLCYEKLPFDTDLKFIIKIIISAIAMSIVLLNLNIEGYVNLLISISICIIVYASTLIFLKGFTKDEYMFLTNAIKYKVRLR